METGRTLDLSGLVVARGACPSRARRSFGGLRRLVPLAALEHVPRAAQVHVLRCGNEAGARDETRRREPVGRRTAARASTDLMLLCFRWRSVGNSAYSITRLPIFLHHGLNVIVIAMTRIRS